MYRVCTSETANQRQLELEAGLLCAMQAQHYDDITISDLCRQMQIPRKAFYRYFSGKDGALHALVDHTLMKLHPPQLEELDVGRSLEKYFAFWQGQRPLLDALARSGLSGVIIQRAILLAATEDTFFSAIFPCDNPLEKEHLATFVMSGMMSMVIQWHQGGFTHSPAALSEVAARLLLKPLFLSSVIR